MKPSPSIPRKAKSGQTLIFMTMVVVMIAFAALFYFDVHKILHVKGISRNAGDSAALAGARWQAISLNLLGSLNVAAAAAITNDLSAGMTTSPEADLIAELQRRITFSGPMFGYVTSQQAAKNNGILNQDSFEEDIRSHISLVENDYILFYPEPFQPVPPYSNAWEEYADMLRLMANDGIAVNAAWQYYRGYTNDNHLLLNPGFYDAIAGRSWCWFFYNAYDELRNYNNWTDWDDLPPIQTDAPVNSEIYSLFVRRVNVRDSIPSLPSESEWSSQMEALRSALTNLRDNNRPAYDDFDATWAFYNPSRWGIWSRNIPDNFPWDGEIRDEYDYAGADAAVAVMAETERHTNFQGADTINWSAGAKPFGSLEGNIRPNAYGIILPAYTDVRLIPIDASMSGGNGQLRPGWLEFILIYLPQYMEYGPTVLPAGNWYANQLRTWESRTFRETGVEWLLDNSDSCYSPPPGGGGGGSGGTFRGH
jgi:hypothetical protein